MKRIAAAIALTLVAGGTASALPLAPAASTAQAPIVLVRDGCGPGFHLNPFGECRPNRGPFFGGPGPGPGPEYGRLPPPCPRGYYRDPNPARPLCYPRY
jgi:hypothetical protein